MAKSSAKEKSYINCPRLRSAISPIDPSRNAYAYRSRRGGAPEGLPHLSLCIEEQSTEDPGDVKHHIYYLTTSRGAHLPVAGGKCSTTIVHRPSLLKKNEARQKDSLLVCTFSQEEAGRDTERLFETIPPCGGGIFAPLKLPGKLRSRRSIRGNDLSLLYTLYHSNASPAAPQAAQERSRRRMAGDLRVPISGKW